MTWLFARLYFQFQIVKTKVTKHCKLCDKCYYRMDHHCLFLLKCVGYNNHARFVWFLIVTVAVMSIFILLAVFWALDKYPVKDYKYAELIFEMFWRDCWVLCMVVLNIASTLWAISLIQYQLKVVSRGHTTYFQHAANYLTSTEKMINMINFLMGKAPYVSGISFEGPIKSNMVKRDIMNVWTMISNVTSLHVYCVVIYFNDILVCSSKMML